MLYAMRDGARLTNDDLMDLFWPDRDPPEWCLNVIRLEIHRLRKAIAPLGMRITNTYGRGWRLERGTGEAVRGGLRQGGWAA
jgi:DNA-binding response OmpR family regulator